jgi:hypothetical protein
VRFSGTFRRVVTLPEDVDPNRVEATYRDGVLQLTLGRREEVQPRRIEVKSRGPCRPTQGAAPARRVPCPITLRGM